MRTLNFAQDEFVAFSALLAEVLDDHPGDPAMRPLQTIRGREHGLPRPFAGIVCSSPERRIRRDCGL
jgi:hypothetical protein